MGDELNPRPCYSHAFAHRGNISRELICIVLAASQQLLGVAQIEQSLRLTVVAPGIGMAATLCPFISRGKQLSFS